MALSHLGHEEVETKYDIAKPLDYLRWQLQAGAKGRLCSAHILWHACNDMLICWAAVRVMHAQSASAVFYGSPCWNFRPKDPQLCTRTASSPCAPFGFSAMHVAPCQLRSMQGHVALPFGGEGWGLVRQPVLCTPPAQASALPW